MSTKSKVVASKAKVSKKAKVATKATKATTKAAISHESTVESPCWLVWDLADKMTAKGAKRKDVIAKALEMGVAFYTARTQYQRWLTAKNASAS